MGKGWRVYPALGERVRVVGCYSEVMMHFGLAGRPVEVALVQGNYVMAQVYKDGVPFSGTILPGEAGFCRDGGGWYVYPDDGPGDANPAQVMSDMRKLINNAIDGSGAKVKTITNLGIL